MVYPAKLLSTSGAHAHGGLESVVDPPLQTSKGADHQHTDAETLGAQVQVAELRSDLSEALALVGRLAHQGHNGVSRVGNDGANNTSNVARSESDSELSGLVVGLLGSSENVSVEELDNLLEEEELGHGVGDLARPEGDDRAEGEASLSRLLDHQLGGRNEGGRPAASGRSLNLHLHHLHGAQSKVSKELSRGRASKPDPALVLLGVLLPGEVGVEVFKVLVEAKLEHALSRVAEQSGEPTLKDGASTLLGDDGLQAGDKTLVLGRVNLHVALGHIQRSHGKMGRAAGDGATKNTLEVVAGIMRNSAGIAGIPLSRGGSGSGLEGLLHGRDQALLLALALEGTLSGSQDRVGEHLGV
mmetsp:Transcript_21871/g.59885  ORF Transcript_21871/g.59885 Transcript_21871/m.59885 type:complete len:357 (-) Transcript_21871:6-1076(-)